MLYRTDEPGVQITKPFAEKMDRTATRVARSDGRTRPQRRREGEINWIKKGILSEDLLHDDFAEVVIWELNADGDSEVATDHTKEAWDWMLQSGKKLPSGAKVVIAHIGRRWYVIASEECQVSQ